MQRSIYRGDQQSGGYSDDDNKDNNASIEENTNIKKITDIENDNSQDSKEG